MGDASPSPLLALPPEVWNRVLYWMELSPADVAAFSQAGKVGYEIAFGSFEDPNVYDLEQHQSLASFRWLEKNLSTWCLITPLLMKLERARPVDCFYILASWGIGGFHKIVNFNLSSVDEKRLGRVTRAAFKAARKARVDPLRSSSMVGFAAWARMPEVIGLEKFGPSDLSAYGAVAGGYLELIRTFDYRMLSTAAVFAITRTNLSVLLEILPLLAPMILSRDLSAETRRRMGSRLRKATVNEAIGNPEVFSAMVGWWSTVAGADDKVWGGLAEKLLDGSPEDDRTKALRAAPKEARHLRGAIYRRLLEMGPEQMAAGIRLLLDAGFPLSAKVIYKWNRYAFMVHHLSRDLALRANLVADDEIARPHLP